MEHLQTNGKIFMFQELECQQQLQFLKQYHKVLMREEEKIQKVQKISLQMEVKLLFLKEQRLLLYRMEQLQVLAVIARTKETMGSIPIHVPKLLFISLLVEILGIVAMMIVDFNYSWLFLLIGFYVFKI